MEMQLMPKYHKDRYESGQLIYSVKKDNSESAIEKYRNDQIEFSPGPHREMAIDCPPNFAWIRKEAPRLPRPSSAALNTSSDSSIIFNKPQQSLSQKDANTDMARMERIKRYQEDLKKKVDLEEKFQREQELLRSSLRGSKKLQDLQEPAVSVIDAGVDSEGRVNPIFVEEEVTFMKRKSSRAFDALSVEDILIALKRLKQQISPQKQSEVGQVEKFVMKEKFKQALNIHDQIVETNLSNIKIPEPSLISAREILSDVSLVASNSKSQRASELVQIFSDPYLRNVLLAHDKLIEFQHEKKVSMQSKSLDYQRDYLFQRASQYGSDTIKIVQLHKTTDPLGLTIRNDAESIVIGRIIKGGVAENSGLLREEDEILEINDVDIRGKTINDVYEMMNGKSGMITFLINPAYEPVPTSQEKYLEKFVRALFDYDPEDDQYLPCKELGISFEKGDILKVIEPKSQDVDWWQAFRVAETDQGLAGLIPSQLFQERREKLRNMLFGVDYSEEDNKRHLCPCLHKSNKKHIIEESKEILTYDDVVLYVPQSLHKRPIILIGPQGLGRQELRQRLMQSDLERFIAAVPHTSRPRRPDEVDGQDYHFVSRLAFESDIINGRFVEFGKYEKHLFGTSMQSVKTVAKSGKTCILTFHPQALKVLKASDLMPYVVFIAPPNIEKLKQLRQREGIKFTEEELQAMIEQGRDMEASFGHYFDLIIIFQDLDRAYEELLSAINDLETKPQWVLANWVT